MTQKQVVVTVLDNEFQSQLCPAFIIPMMTHWKGQAAMECLIQSKHTQSGCEQWGLWSRNFHHPQPKSRAVVMVIHHEFPSQLCLALYYTYNETLEGSS